MKNFYLNIWIILMTRTTVLPGLYRTLRNLIRKGKNIKCILPNQTEVFKKIKISDRILIKTCPIIQYSILCHSCILHIFIYDVKCNEKHLLSLNIRTMSIKYDVTRKQKNNNQGLKIQHFLANCFLFVTERPQFLNISHNSFFIGVAPIVFSK